MPHVTHPPFIRSVKREQARHDIVIRLIANVPVSHANLPEQQEICIRQLGVLCLGQTRYSAAGTALNR